MERDNFGRFVKGHKGYQQFKKNAKTHKHDGLARHSKSVKHRGSHRTAAYKRRISATVSRLWQDPEYIAKHVGTNNPNWKGGLMNDYKTFTWRMRGKLRVWANKVKARDKKCLHCGSKKELEADHIRPAAKFPDLALDIENGRTLCFDCHRNTDSYGKKLPK